MDKGDTSPKWDSSAPWSYFDMESGWLIEHFL